MTKKPCSASHVFRVGGRKCIHCGIDIADVGVGNHVTLTGDWPLDAPPLEGRKDDGGKARHDLLAPEYLTGTAEILAFGAAKYGARNWEKGMAWSRPFAALMRHMWAWWAGEQVDPETGKSHLWHASCCLMFLVAYEHRKSGTDDRPNSA